MHHAVACRERENDGQRSDPQADWNPQQSGDLQVAKRGCCGLAVTASVKMLVVPLQGCIPVF